nr:zinc finger, CCHC-type [Tanacetum cinerariifolium]
MSGTIPPIPSPFGTSSGNPGSPNVNRVDTMPTTTDRINITTTTNVSQSVVDENLLQLLDSRGGSHVTNVLSIPSTYLLKTLEDGPFVPMSSLSTSKKSLPKRQNQWSNVESRLANQDKRLKIIIISCLPNDVMKPVIKCKTAKKMWNYLILAHEGPSDTRDTKIAALRLKFNAFKSLEGEKDSDPDVEEDQRTSNEFMADLNAEYHERALLANQYRFYKRSRKKLFFVLTNQDPIMSGTIPPIPPPFGTSSGNPGSPNVNRVDTMPTTTDRINITTTTNVSQSVVDENLPQLLDSRGGSHVTNVPAFDKEDSTSCKVSLSTSEKSLSKRQNQWSNVESRLANQDKRLKIIIISCLPNDVMKSVIKCKTIKEMWNDLILAHEGPSDTRDTKIAALRLKFNAFKSLEGEKDSDSDVEEDQRTSNEFMADLTKIKAFMAIAEDEPSVGKADARSGQWVDITMKKIHRLLSMTDGDERKHVLDYTHVDLHYVEDQRKTWLINLIHLNKKYPYISQNCLTLKTLCPLIALFKMKSLGYNLENESLKDEIIDLKKVIEK